MGVSKLYTAYHVRESGMKAFFDLGADKLGIKLKYANENAGKLG